MPVEKALQLEPERVLRSFFGDVSIVRFSIAMGLMRAGRVPEIVAFLVYVD